MECQHGIYVRQFADATALSHSVFAIDSRDVAVFPAVSVCTVAQAARRDMSGSKQNNVQLNLNAPKKGKILGYPLLTRLQDLYILV